MGLRTLFLPLSLLSGSALVLLGLVQTATVPSASTLPEATLTLSAVADATVSSAAPNDNFGSDTVLSLSYISSDAIAETLTLLRFDLNDLPSDAIITSATLQLYLADSGGTNPVNVAAYFVTGTWDESSVTWNTFPTAEVLGIVASIDGTTGAYKQWNITSYAQNWLTGPNRGLFLRGLTDGPFYQRTFESREQEENPPQLVVTYQTPTADLVMESLAAQPSEAYAKEQVEITARIRNTGPDTFAQVPVRYTADGDTLDTRVVPDILPGTTVSVTTTWAFSTTGVISLTAVVNPEGTLFEATTDNNTATTALNVVLEKDPPWSRADLALSNLEFTPHRPDPGSDLEVTAYLGNLSVRNPVSSTVVVLLIDHQIVDEMLLTNLAPGSTQMVALTWTNATAGRHPLQLIADPDNATPETYEDNNRLSDTVRVAGSSDPLPDIEVENIDFDPALPNAGEDVTITVELHNEGDAPAADLPLLVTVDGRELGRKTITSLAPGESMTWSQGWAGGEGQHTIAAWIDPDDLVQDVSLQDSWAREFLVPGAQIHLPPAAARAGQWEFLGPRPIVFQGTDALGVDIGRMNGIAISQQPGRGDVIVVGSEGGGVWRTEDGGKTWRPLGDQLPSLDVPVVALDPTDDQIIYAASPEGLYKSLDAGGHWDTFVEKGWVNARYSRLTARYEQPGIVTLYAATRNGLWVWQGDPRAVRATREHWHQVWDKAQHARSNAPAGATNTVLELVVTEETVPQVYIGVLGDTVYRIALASLLNGAKTGSPIAWTPLPEKLPSDGTLRLGNSAANATRLFAAVKRASGAIETYYRDFSDTEWTLIGTPAVKTKCDPASYIDFVKVHPTNPNMLYVGGINGCRSSDGGKTFDLHIPSVHADYKDMAFDPANPSVVYFTSDGGVYRCTNNATTCASLNADLETTMFFDIALAGTGAPVIGGTQDNGTLLYDGASLTWHKIRGTDGKYTAIDPNNSQIMYSQDQYVDSTMRSESGGQSWVDAHGMLPSKKDYTGDPFVVMHPLKANTLLIAAREVYRTTDRGEKWDPIGPTGPWVMRIAVDGVNNRYYAGRAGGQILAVAADQAAANTWTPIYTHPAGEGASTLLLDPTDTNVLWATFWGAGASRVVKLAYQGRANDWPGTQADWTATPIAAALDWERRLAGGPGLSVRGLLKDPAGNVLYVGTDHGVYRGELSANSWQWAPDTCGLPRTAVSDLELLRSGGSGGYMVAATFGRGAYGRDMAILNPTPDAYDRPNRNDEPSSAKPLGTVQETITRSGLEAGLAVADLNLDHPRDVDFFTIQLPPWESGMCLGPGDARLNDPRTSQCALAVRVHAPESPDPLELQFYAADGTVLRDFTERSYLSYLLARPYDFFPNGQITLSVRGLTGCRSEYGLEFWYHRWYREIDAPDILFDPPMVKWVLPALDNFSWLYPADPEMINQGFVEQVPSSWPAQRALFEWKQEGDFSATLSIAGMGNVDVALYDGQGNRVTGTAPLGRQLFSRSDTHTRQIGVPALPAGWYALEFTDGTFPTYFEVMVNRPHIPIFLPLVRR